MIEEVKVDRLWIMENTLNTFTYIVRTLAERDDDTDELVMLARSELEKIGLVKVNGIYAHVG